MLINFPDHFVSFFWISNFYGSLVEKDMNGNWNRLKSVQILSRLLTKQSYYEGEIKCSNINNSCFFVCMCHVYFLCVFLCIYTTINDLYRIIGNRKKHSRDWSLKTGLGLKWGINLKIHTFVPILAKFTYLLVSKIDWILYWVGQNCGFSLIPNFKASAVFYASVSIINWSSILGAAAFMYLQLTWSKV